MAGAEMSFNIKIPIPKQLELFMARIFGEYLHKSCMESHISGYKWRGKIYITKQWIEEGENV